MTDLQTVAALVINRCGRCNEDFTGPPAGRGRSGGKLCPTGAAGDAAAGRTYRVRKLPAGTYVVVNAEGERVSRVWRDEAEAIAWLERRVSARQPGKKRCLRCSKLFDSHGPCHRLCGGCESHARGSALNA